MKTDEIKVERSFNWDDKSAIDIYTDILGMTTEMFEKSEGDIDETTPLVLILPIRMKMALYKITEFCVCANDMLKKYFEDIEYVGLKEVRGSKNTVILVPQKIKDRVLKIAKKQ